MQIPPFVSLCKYGFWSHERTHSISSWFNGFIKEQKKRSFSALEEQKLSFTLLDLNFIRKKTHIFCSNNADKPFFALSVFRQSVENIPSVQSLVATSRRPNICGAVIALGFMRISRWGAPQSPIAFMSMLIQIVLPAPLGPRVIIPWRTRWVSYNCNETAMAHKVD